MLPSLVDALEAGDDRDRASRRARRGAARVDRADARPAEGACRSRCAPGARGTTSAGTPRSWSAIARSAAVTCSPVATSTSLSRSVGVGRHLSREREQPVGLARHRGDHHHQAVPLSAIRAPRAWRPRGCARRRRPRCRRTSGRSVPRMRSLHPNGETGIAFVPHRESLRLARLPPRGESSADLPLRPRCRSPASMPPSACRACGTTQSP